MSTIRAAVIGSGFGGLALAIRLQSRGIKTTLLEKRDKPGGRAYVYKDKGFTFDAGPTVITAPHCLEELFAVSGRKLSDHINLLPVSPFYRLCWEDGYRFDYSNDIESVLAQIGEKNPRDVEGYQKFAKYAEAVFEKGYVDLAAEPFLNWWSMIRVSPHLAKLQAHRSVYSMVSKFIKDPQIRQVFSFHSLLVGGNPFTTSSIYTLIHALERRWGVFFPKGGTGALVHGLIELFQELGGEVRLACDVESIEVSGGRVTGVRAKDGYREAFDVVASNGDVVHTYRNLLSGDRKSSLRGQALSRRRFSMSLFVAYFGVSKRYPDVAHHSVLFGPRYREHLKDIFQGRSLPEDFSLYLHAPTITDPDIAPKDSEAFYVLSPVPHLGHARINWEIEGPRYRDRIFEYLEERYLPGLRDRLVTTRIFTPKDFEEVFYSHHGSAFSLEPILAQSAYFRVHNRDKNVKGLYFVGAGTHPGAGIPGVVNSAKATARLIFEDAGFATDGAQ